MLKYKFKTVYFEAWLHFCRTAFDCHRAERIAKINLSKNMFNRQIIWSTGALITFIVNDKGRQKKME